MDTDVIRLRVAAHPRRQAPQQARPPWPTVRPGRHTDAVLVIVGALVAGLVVLAGGGDAFWVCVPGSLLVAALSPSRPAGLIRGGAVILAAAVPSLISASQYPLPATAL